MPRPTTMEFARPRRHIVSRAVRLVALSGLIVGAGCAGRTDVTAGPDQARNLPARPHETPKQSPTPTMLGQKRGPATEGESAAAAAAARKARSGEHAMATTQGAYVVPPPDPAKVQVVDGFRVEVAMTGLTYPTSAEFDDAGNLYVAEAG